MAHGYTTLLARATLQGSGPDLADGVMCMFDDSLGNGACPLDIIPGDAFEIVRFGTGDFAVWCTEHADYRVED